MDGIGVRINHKCEIIRMWIVGTWRPLRVVNMGGFSLQMRIHIRIFLKIEVEYVKVFDVCDQCT